MELLDRCRLWIGRISGGMTFGVPEGGGGCCRPPCCSNRKLESAGPRNLNADAMIDPGIAIGGDQKVRQQIQKLLLHQHHRNWLVKRASRIALKDRRAVRHWRSSRRCQSIEMRR
jgi:hypothetical protein